MADTAGYSGTPLPRKLGLKAGMRVRLLDPPEGYWSLLGDEVENLSLETLQEGSESADFTHLFAADRRSLEEGFVAARSGMTVDGMVWASWPKKSSGVATEIAKGDVMAAGKEVGLVDVKVCAVDETWSGLKFVIPVEDR
jgi:hypothetical protein